MRHRVPEKKLRHGQMETMSGHPHEGVSPHCGYDSTNTPQCLEISHLELWAKAPEPGRWHPSVPANIMLRAVWAAITCPRHCGYYNSRWGQCSCSSGIPLQVMPSRDCPSACWWLPATRTRWRWWQSSWAETILWGGPVVRYPA